jgi:tetratricopeptide (TPR) repeat protein
MEQYDIAIERFEKSLQNGDSSLIVNSSLGLSYNKVELDSLAHYFLHQASLQDATNNNILFYLGKTNYNLGYYQEAVECYLKVIENLVQSDALLFTLYKELAMSQDKSEAFHDALKTYQTAFKYTNDNKDRMALYYLMAVAADEGLKEYDRALTYYRLYRTTLINYRYSLKEDKQQEIDEIESKLTALDEYIKQLTEESIKQKQ